MAWVRDRNNVMRYPNTAQRQAQSVALPFFPELMSLKAIANLSISTTVLDGLLLSKIKQDDC
jgi:hypothetical protein